MNADEIVRALRWLSKDTEFIFVAENLNEAADLIESLQAENKNIRNELCQRCGRYREAHIGSCDGCRWKENEHG